MTRASVVIPAHNEEAVIGRVLDELASLVSSGSIEISVICNGCSDETESVARRYPGVRVFSTPLASKTEALNLGDRVATRFPRVYLDADVEISAAALMQIVRALEVDGGVIAAHPEYIYRTEHSSPLVKAYYRSRTRLLPGFYGHLWGAGCYALTAVARSRFEEFPRVVADDLWVDSLFDGTEKVAVTTAPPVQVFAPRDSRSLIRVLGRVNSGRREVESDVSLSGASPKLTSSQLFKACHGVADLFDMLTYVGFSLVGRVAATLQRADGWSRDDSSRRQPSKLL